MSNNVIRFPGVTPYRERFLARLKEDLTKREYAAFCCGIIDEDYYNEAPDFILELIHEYYDICEAEEEVDLYMEFGHGSSEEK